MDKSPPSSLRMPATDENTPISVATELDGSTEVVGRRSRRNNITRQMRKAKAIERATKNNAAWMQLDVAMRNYREDIARIAKENDVSANTLRTKAMHASVIRKSRKTNKYNAYRRFKKVNLETHNFSK